MIKTTDNQNMELLIAQLKDISVHKERYQPEEMEEVKPPEYKPNKQSLEKLTNVNPILYDAFRHFSFSRVFTENSFNKNNWYRILRHTFPYKYNQIVRMSNETQATVKELGIKGIMATFHTHRANFFVKDEMIEPDYEENRLAYLIQRQKEPSRVYSNEEYDYILFHFKDMITKAIDVFFSSDPAYQSPQTYKDLLLDFHYRMLERFDTLSDTLLEALQTEFLGKIRKESVSEEDYIRYKNYQIPLLTWRIKMEEKEEDIFKKVKILHSMINIFDTCIRKPEIITPFLTKESAAQIMDAMICLANFEEEELNSIQNPIIVKQTLKDINNFLDNLAPFIQLVENNFLDDKHTK